MGRGCGPKMEENIRDKDAAKEGTGQEGGPPPLSLHQLLNSESPAKDLDDVPVKKKKQCEIQKVFLSFKIPEEVEQQQRDENEPERVPLDYPALFKADLESGDGKTKSACGFCKEEASSLAALVYHKVRWCRKKTSSDSMTMYFWKVMMSGDAPSASSSFSYCCPLCRAEVAETRLAVHVRQCVVKAVRLEEVRQRRESMRAIRDLERSGVRLKYGQEASPMDKEEEEVSQQSQACNQCSLKEDCRKPWPLKCNVCGKQTANRHEMLVHLKSNDHSANASAVVPKTEEASKASPRTSQEKRQPSPTKLEAGGTAQEKPAVILKKKKQVMKSAKKGPDPVKAETAAAAACRMCGSRDRRVLSTRYCSECNLKVRSRLAEPCVSQCKVCGTETSSRLEMTAHLKSKEHKDLVAYLKKEKVMSRQKRKEERLLGGAAPCQECGRRDCRDLTTLYCGKCTFAMSSRHWLFVHMRDAHGEESCEACWYRGCRTPCAAARCAVCDDLDLGCVHNLDRHWKVEHSPEERVVGCECVCGYVECRMPLPGLLSSCGRCGQVVLSRHDQVMHRRQKHRETLEENVNKEEEEEEEAGVDLKAIHFLAGLSKSRQDSDASGSSKRKRSSDSPPGPASKRSRKLSSRSNAVLSFSEDLEIVPDNIPYQVPWLLLKKLAPKDLEDLSSEEEEDEDIEIEGEDRDYDVLEEEADEKEDVSEVMQEVEKEEERERTDSDDYDESQEDDDEGEDEEEEEESEEKEEEKSEEKEEEYSEEKQDEPDVMVVEEDPSGSCKCGAEGEVCRKPMVLVCHHCKHKSKSRHGYRIHMKASHALDLEGEKLYDYERTAKVKMSKKRRCDCGRVVEEECLTPVSITCPRCKGRSGSRHEYRIHMTVVHNMDLSKNELHLERLQEAETKKLQAGEKEQEETLQEEEVVLECNCGEPGENCQEVISLVCLQCHESIMSRHEYRSHVRSAHPEVDLVGKVLNWAKRLNRAHADHWVRKDALLLDFQERLKRQVEQKTKEHQQQPQQLLRQQRLSQEEVPEERCRCGAPSGEDCRADIFLRCRLCSCMPMNRHNYRVHMKGTHDIDLGGMQVAWESLVKSPRKAGMTIPATTSSGLEVSAVDRPCLCGAAGENCKTIVALQCGLCQRKLMSRHDYRVHTKAVHRIDLDGQKLHWSPLPPKRVEMSKETQIQREGLCECGHGRVSCRKANPMTCSHCRYHVANAHCLFLHMKFFHSGGANNKATTTSAAKSKASPEKVCVVGQKEQGPTTTKFYLVTKSGAVTERRAVTAEVQERQQQPDNSNNALGLRLVNVRSLTTTTNVFQQPSMSSSAASPRTVAALLPRHPLPAPLPSAAATPVLLRYPLPPPPQPPSTTTARQILPRPPLPPPPPESRSPTASMSGGRLSVFFRYTKSSVMANLSHPQAMTACTHCGFSLCRQKVQSYACLLCGVAMGATRHDVAAHLMDRHDYVPDRFDGRLGQVMEMVGECPPGCGTCGGAGCCKESMNFVPMPQQQQQQGNPLVVMATTPINNRATLMPGYGLPHPRLAVVGVVSPPPVVVDPIAVEEEEEEEAAVAAPCGMENDKGEGDVVFVDNDCSFACCVCDFETRTGEELNRHMDEEH